jgi:hypothetical protein
MAVFLELQSVDSLETEMVVLKGEKKVWQMDSVLAALLVDHLAIRSTGESVSQMAALMERSLEC